MSRKGIGILLALMLVMTACSVRDEITGKYDAIYTCCAPEDTVLTIGEKEISWQEYFYHVAYYMTYLEESVGEIGDWSEPFYGSVSYLQFALDGATEWLVYDAALEIGADEAQCFIDSEDERILAAQWDGIVRSYESEAALLEEMKTHYCTKEIYQMILRNLLLSEKYFETRYGCNGCDLTDHEVENYTAYDGYLMAKQIFISTENTTDGEYADRLKLAQDMATTLKYAPDDKREEKFCELKDSYTAECSFIRFYEDELFAYGDVGDEIYDGTLTSPIGQVSSILETENGFHLMLRMPVDYDAIPMAYSEMVAVEAGQYTLRSLTARAMYEDHLAEIAQSLKVEYNNVFLALDLASLRSIKAE